MAFQSQINNQPAVAIEGDFCSANPRSSMLSSVGGLVAGPAGVTVGRFAWADQDGVARSSGGVGRIGFVHRANLAVIPAWLGRTSMSVPAGYEIALHASGDFWARFAGGATPGQKVWANFADGSCVSSPSGSAPSSASATGVIAAGSASFTGSIAPAAPFNGDQPGGVLTVSATTSGTIYPGAALAGTGVASGQTVVSQLSGTAGGIGTYEVSISQTVASEALTTAHGVLTISGSVTGAFGVGDTLSGTNVVAGTQITALGTGTGGTGTYIVNNNTAVSSTTISAATAVETAWYVDTYAAAGELAKISRAG